MIYFCSQQKRRALVLQHPTLNGIDYLEVCDAVMGGCGKKLLLTLLKDAPEAGLTAAQVRIAGGGATQVHAMKVDRTTSAPRLLTIELDATGDFSTYTLSLTANGAAADPPDDFDPQLSAVDFSFKPGCDTSADCAAAPCCPPAPVVKPDINYLAKEFDGFTQVMLDRLAVLVPGWTETHPADTGIALVEALAYAADHLSYQQDAAGAEAYIGTARSRISLRRHAKLVDYSLDEGSNARTWVFMEAAKDAAIVGRGTRFYPRAPGFPAVVKPDSGQEQQLNGALAFEAMHDATLFQEQNEMQFYTWCDQDCCLAPGSTQATLANHYSTLNVGDVLIFEEKRGPDTGDPDDADVSKRWAVRLTDVRVTDYLGRPLVDPLNNSPITQIRWDSADALPFPLCVAATTDSSHQSRAFPDVGVARGNVVAADHGIWGGWEDLGAVPAAPPAPVSSGSCSGVTGPVDAPRPRYHPHLANDPLTFAAAFDATAPAAAFLAPSSPPAAQLEVRDDRLRDWTVVADLLSSDASDMAVVPEIERDNVVFLRFGDGEHGMSADAASSFQACYRTGNGTAGNIGRDSLAHIATAVDGIRQVRNPMAAKGGRDPETIEHIRQFAPFSFRGQLRAVTEEDYGTMAQSDPAIRAARGTLRWTGSWHTAFVPVDAVAGDTPSAALVAATLDRLNRFRMAGVDLAVEGAVIAGLRIEMNVCVDPDHFQSDVRDAIMRVFVAGTRNGQPGVLDPGNFMFGQTVYASPLIAAAQAVEGVSSVGLSVFQRLDDPTFDGTAQGFLAMRRLEIARCDNDPNRLDRGIFVLHMDGGK